jgi:ribosomal protein S18 acetylase RimI-like enzyme
VVNSEDVLDNPVWAALTGPQRQLAEVRGRAAKFPADMAPFAALAEGADQGAWDDLGELVGAGEAVALAGPAVAPPEHWEVVARFPGVQLVDAALDDAALDDAALDAATDPEAGPLAVADVPEMLDLVARTEPGPFRPRTIELGRYLGIRRGGALVAMAGERLHLPGWTEISAVCTDPAHRGQGLGSRLVRAVAAGIRARGETPFLHASADNTSAIRLYQALGFTLRRKLTFLVVRVPE